MRIIICSCFLALLTIPALVRAEESQGVSGKNLCLLNSTHCPDRKPTIQELIDQLQSEIAKGETVYTREELQTLRRKLQEAESLEWWIRYGR